jgi:hypothetical protein
LHVSEGADWEMSGEKSHIMVQIVALDESWTATQMLEEIARDLAVSTSGVETLEVR